MIINKVLDKLFISSAITAVLRQLNLRIIGITGREIARQPGLTHRTALKALDSLEALKLVNKSIAGKAYYFTINRESYLFKKVIVSIFEAEREMLSAINKEIKLTLGKYTESVILFGSVSRSEETYGSDFDICVVYKSGKSNLIDIISELRDKLYHRYGISLAPYFITKNEFADRARKKKQPINEILKEGIVISGKIMKELQNG